MDIENKITEIENVSLSCTPLGTDTRIDINIAKDIIVCLRKAKSDLSESERSRTELIKQNQALAAENERLEAVIKAAQEQEPAEWQRLLQDEWVPCSKVRAEVTSDPVRALYAYPVPAQSPTAKGGWKFCPECGSTEIRHEEGSHKQCGQCHQEWFSDIDYSDVVAGNLMKLFNKPAVAVPDFLLEMSKQMQEQPSRSTSHPFWQVRCKRYIVTERGYNEAGFEIYSDDGVVYRSYAADEEELEQLLLEDYPEFCKEWHDGLDNGDSIEDSISGFDPTEDQLPDGLQLVYVQETEEIVSTHFTQHDAEWFIRRKQHDYPKLYTYVESAYWSPQIKQLQDWIISLSSATTQSHDSCPSHEPLHPIHAAYGVQDSGVVEE